MADFCPKEFDRLDLRSEERIIFEGKPQKSYILKLAVPFILVLISAAVALAIFWWKDEGSLLNAVQVNRDQPINGALVFILFVSIPIGLTLLRRLLEPLRWLNEYYIVTTERALTCSGLFRKRFKEVFLNEVEGVELKIDSILDKPFNVGNIHFDRERLVLNELEVGQATILYKKINEIVSNNAVNTRLGQPKEEKTLAYHEYPTFEYETDYLDGGSNGRIQ
jgi:hypothetical protein